MQAMIIQADDIVVQLVDAGIPQSDVTEVNAKGLAGEVVTAALFAFGSGAIAAVAKVIVELIRREKKFSVKLNGDEIEFSATNINPDEIEDILSKLIKPAS